MKKSLKTVMNLPFSTNVIKKPLKDITVIDFNEFSFYY